MLLQIDDPASDLEAGAQLVAIEGLVM